MNFKYLSVSSFEDAKLQIEGHMQSILKEGLYLHLALPNGEGGLIVSRLCDSTISVFPGSIGRDYRSGKLEVINRDGWLGNTKVTRGCAITPIESKDFSEKSLRLVYSRAKKHQALTGCLL